MYPTAYPVVGLFVRQSPCEVLGNPILPAKAPSPDAIIWPSLLSSTPARSQGLISPSPTLRSFDVGPYLRTGTPCRWDMEQMPLVIITADGYPSSQFMQVLSFATHINSSSDSNGELIDPDSRGSVSL
ncbi:hypothetical protein CDEST_13274 [Colletotrichum destructivum]|uniref:Uncharacterized protein n=1 Tax=Colletotrichum destructivum TaxID=34406 RepID=A0AAX4IYE8_9PEZI|nr:hypothetical protein CDEST_13274 [Colletotrichum destructivum]